MFEGKLEKKKTAQSLNIIALLRRCYRPKTHERLRRTLLDQTKQDRCTSVSCTDLSGRTQLAAAKLFICLCTVLGFEEKDSPEHLHSVLSCLIKKLFCLFVCLFCFLFAFFFI